MFKRLAAAHSRPASATSPLWLQAVLETMPLAVAVIPWGVLIGALGIQMGLSFWQAQAMSLFVFAGAAQLSALTLLSAGAAPLGILGSTFVISSRHILYSIIFRQHMLQLPFRWRASIAFLLTDEMFAVSQAHTDRSGQFSPKFALISGIAFYLVWNISTLVGIIAGDSIDDLHQLGLDFAIAATFIAMTINEIRRWPMAIAMLVSGALSVVLKPFLPDSYIVLSALLGMSAAFIADSGEE